MKALVHRYSKIVTNVFADDQNVIPMGDHVQTPTSKILCENFYTVELIQGLTPPADYADRKYLYKDGEWSLNPDYVPDFNADDPNFVIDKSKPVVPSANAAIQITV